MIAVDTNILVYAHRADSQWHEAANNVVTGLAEDRAAWAIPWPCLHEFLAIVTHPRIFEPATPLDQAIDQVSAWLESPSLVTLCETAGYFEVLSRIVASGHIQGPRIHDARIAAVCVIHGVHALYSADRDFSRFPSLRVTNPLLD